MASHCLNRELCPQLHDLLSGFLNLGDLSQFCLNFSGNCSTGVLIYSHGEKLCMIASLLVC